MDIDRQKLLSVTTRGIGLGTCNLCYIAATSGIEPEPPVYVLYRVYLGLAESKLDSITFFRKDNLCAFKVNGYICEQAQKVAIVPAQIKQIIDALHPINSGSEYMPVVAGLLRDATGRLVPRPENLLLSNLRETVVALSKPDTPAQYRAAFRQNCPIPGAVWNNNLLQNADEIIPKGYHVEKSLWDEMWAAFMFLNRLKEKYPLMGNGYLNGRGFPALASRAALVSSTMDDIRAIPREVGESVASYCKRCSPVGGYMGESYALEKLSDADEIAGKAALLGELPNEDVLDLLGEIAEPIKSVYSLREEQLGGRNTVFSDYMIALMQTNEELLEKVPRSASSVHSSSEESAGSDTSA